MIYRLLATILIITSYQASASQKSSPNIASVMNLIAKTEAAAPKGVKGTFRFLVKETGISGGIIYLNTEHDYRDRRNISIELSPNIIEELTKKYAGKPEVLFVDKMIEVTGVAKRVTIYFMSRQRKNRKYYFQTHIKVDSVDQIKLV
ncbi:MAG: hypothetical protein Q9M92_08825 [Enterobacterales bacterium]|nr:hypothetical protein [Enterobacterales bacterium]